MLRIISIMFYELEVNFSLFSISYIVIFWQLILHYVLFKHYKNTPYLYLKQSTMKEKLEDWISKKTDWPILATSIANFLNFSFREKLEKSLMFIGVWEIPKISIIFKMFRNFRKSWLMAIQVDVLWSRGPLPTIDWKSWSRGP